MQAFGRIVQKIDRFCSIFRGGFVLFLVIYGQIPHRISFDLPVFEQSSVNLSEIRNFRTFILVMITKNKEFLS